MNLKFGCLYDFYKSLFFCVESERINMRILAVGDVVGTCGINYIENNLSDIIKECEADFTVVNGENAYKGKGIDKKLSDIIFSSGADCITLGNHAFFNRKIEQAFLSYPNSIVRPINMEDEYGGRGYTVINKNNVKIGIINALGTIYMKKYESPYPMIFEVVDKMKNDGVNIILIDFHAEATSEKKALAAYLDGKVSVVFGTHTHTPTADEQIFNGGTAFISDIGMTGAQDGILGLKKEISIDKIIFGKTVRFEWSENNPKLQGIIIDVDEITGKALAIERIEY